MQEFHQENFTGERALFRKNNLVIHDSVFEDGESPLKECADIEVYNSCFKWKYPFWYCDNIKVKESTFFEMARAGIWYSKNINIEDSVIEAPKSFRRTENIHLRNVSFCNAQETLWHCDNIIMNDINVKGDYFAMNSNNISASNLTLVGDYSFDGSKNVEIRDSKLISKDAFWNSENITVYNSFISGEYLGWNAKNLTLINCTIESLQGLCYIDNLVMRNCKLINTTLAFEYSSVDAEINGKIESVINPKSGRIVADTIKELIIDKDIVDSEKTIIICNND